MTQELTQRASLGRRPNVAWNLLAVEEGRLLVLTISVLPKTITKESKFSRLSSKASWKSLSLVPQTCDTAWHLTVSSGTSVPGLEGQSDPCRRLYMLHAASHVGVGEMQVGKRLYSNCKGKSTQTLALFRMFVWLGHFVAACSCFALRSRIFFFELGE